MGYPNTQEAQGCASTYTGPMGGIGFVREIVCGQTPDVRVIAEQDQYYEDPTNPGNFHLYGFGIIKGITPDFNPNQKKTRGIGHRDIHCNRHSQYETTLEVEYQPVDLVRIPFITGIDDDIQSLTGPVCVQDCLPWCSIETAHERDCPEEKAARLLHDMSILDTFSCEVELGEYVSWSESLMCRYQRESSTKLYDAEAPFDEVQVGLNPLEPCCDAFMSYEGDVYKTIKVTNENLTDQIVAGGTSIFVLDYNVMDFNRDGEIDGELAMFQNRECYRDIYVYVDGVLINDTNEVTVSPINSKYIQLATPIMPGQTITATYRYMYQIFNSTAYDFEIAHASKESRGIWNGLPIPYEIQNVIRTYTGNMTVNFKDMVEYREMKNDEYFHLFFEQGAAGSTPIVWIFCFAKWDNVNPPHNEDDLISMSLPWQATHLCIDNQIRMPPNGSVEEG